MVTKHGFSVVKLLKVDFIDERIKMDFQCMTTGIRKQILIDVVDREFKFLLVSWEDIRKMAMDENLKDSTLLEFEF